MRRAGTVVVAGLIATAAAVGAGSPAWASGGQPAAAAGGKTTKCVLMDDYVDKNGKHVRIYSCTTD